MSLVSPSRPAATDLDFLRTLERTPALQDKVCDLGAVSPFFRRCAPCKTGDPPPRLALPPPRPCAPDGPHRGPAVPASQQGNTCKVLNARQVGEQPVDAPQLKALLAPYPSDDMICWPVRARVGNVRNNDPSLIEPVAAAG
jgi:hypothetical protein